MTTVVNVKVKYIRPTFDNLQEWENEENHEYIGRGGVVFINKERYPKKNSKWHNPYKISKNGLTREQALEKYEKHLEQMLKDPNTKEEFLALKNKTLGCWCHPEQCHGDIIVKVLNTICDT